MDPLWNLLREHQDRTFPVVAASYICGLTDETNELHEDYKMQFENGPFNSEATETGNRLSDEIAEAQQKRWRTLIE